MEYDIEIIEKEGGNIVSVKVDEYSIETHRSLQVLRGTISDEFDIWVVLGEHKYSWGNFLHALDEVVDDNESTLYFIQSIMKHTEKPSPYTEGTGIDKA